MCMRRVVIGMVLTVCAASGCSDTSTPSGSHTSSALMRVSSPVGDSAPSHASASASASAGSRVVTVTGADSSPVTIAVGDIIDVMLASAGYRQDGTPVMWPRPTAYPASVLGVSDSRRLPECLANATCEAFVGLQPGTATIQAPGPGGIICDVSGQNCVGVARRPGTSP